MRPMFGAAASSREVDGRGVPGKVSGGRLGPLRYGFLPWASVPLVVSPMSVGGRRGALPPSRVFVGFGRLRRGADVRLSEDGAAGQQGITENGQP